MVASAAVGPSVVTLALVDRLGWVRPAMLALAMVSCWSLAGLREKVGVWALLDL